MDSNQNKNVSSSRPINGLSIAGLILTFFIPIVGLILSIIALIQSKNKNENPVCAIIGTIISGLYY
jgi:hypothetical protein